ncbi:hypothetical protein ABBQ32_011143 [Trebouxia sp. C0010 RCD-2024]
MIPKAGRPGSGVLIAAASAITVLAGVRHQQASKLKKLEEKIGTLTRQRDAVQAELRTSREQGIVAVEELHQKLSVLAADLINATEALEAAQVSQISCPFFRCSLIF